MAFLFPAAELLLESVEAGVGGQILSGIYDEFKPKIQDKVTTELGNAAGNFAKNNKIAKETLDKAYVVSNIKMTKKVQKHKSRKRRTG
tara:strand:- start:658 stop:921 length:264 start_codon:yes stop_codon:yes gene_type:complete